MKKYEIMYILNANLDEEARKAEIEKLHGILQGKKAKILDVKEWGLRDFAYPINFMTKGYYMVIQVEADSEALNEFTRLGKINRNLVRHLITVIK